jgi:FAD synthase
MVYDYIRGEVKFDGLDALKAQLNKDREKSIAILQAHP